MKKLLLLLFALSIAMPIFSQITYTCPPCGNSCDTLTFKSPGKCPHCGMKLIAADEKVEVKPLKVLFYLQDGVEVLDFAGPMEVFTAAGFKISTVARRKDTIISQGILKIIPDYSIDDAPPADIIAFFGGSTGKESNDSAVMHWLKNVPAPSYYFSVCTGAFFLGKAGILDHLTVTTFHLSIDDLQKTVPSAKVLSNVRFVDNGHIITTAGISAGIDGALHLVARVYNEKVAKQIADYIEYDKWVPSQGLIVGDK